jgi:gliding motility-associated-like protein
MFFEIKKPISIFFQYYILILSTQPFNHFKMTPLFYKFFFFGIIVSCTFSANAQLINGCVFKKGTFVEVGIAPNGGFGTPENAPTGYHPRPSSTIGSGPNMHNPFTGIMTSRPMALGFVADWDLNGFTNGTPAFIGDYFMPGSVQEGWGIDVNGERHNAYTSNYGSNISTGFTNVAGVNSTFLSGTNVSTLNTGSSIISKWLGNFGNPTQLEIEQQTSLKINKSYFVMKVKIKNTSSTVATKVFYTRSVDPDNDQAISGGGTFTTKNTIAYQLPNASNNVMVKAEGIVNTMAYLGLGSKDCRATAFVKKTGLYPVGNLSAIHAQNETNYNFSGTSSVDACIGLVFNLGDIPPGDSVLFAYAYVLNELDLEEAFSETSTGFDIGGVFVPAAGTFNQPFGTNQNICVSNSTGYNWQWFLNGVSVGTGACYNNTATLVNQTLQAVGTPGAIGPCPIAGGGSVITLTLTVAPIISPPPPPVVISPVKYCLGDVAVPLIATATGLNPLNWYTQASGGTALPSAPIPITTGSGSTTYYVSQGNSPIMSPRVPIEVIVNVLPTLTANITSNGKCVKDSIQLNAVSNNVTYLWSPNIGASITNTASIMVAPPSSTTYNVLVTDTNGCKRNATLNTIVNPRPTVNILSASNELCLKDSLLLQAQGSLASYVWSPGTTLNTTSGSNVFAKPIVDTWVKVIATNSFNCTSADSIFLTVLPLPKPNLGPDVFICDTSTSVFSPGAFVDYFWQDASTNPTFSTKNIGTYHVEVEGVNGCFATDTVKILGYFPLPKNFLPANQEICSNFTLTLNIPGYQKYLWSTNDTTNTINVRGANVVRLLVTDNNNCTGADTLTLTAKYCINYAVPNSFTPNGDGRNEIFKPSIFETSSKYKLAVFDRWGKKIFETTQLSSGWDGTINGTRQPIGTYVYTMQYTDFDGKLVKDAGTITLLR